MTTATKILLIFMLSLSFAGIAKADAGFPSTQITFYFQQNGQPVTQPVKFNIKCYGTPYLVRDKKIFAETKELLKISELSEICPSYGCKFDIRNIFDVFGKITKYCNLEGEINAQKFTVNNFLGDNLSELSCYKPDYTISTGDKYYKETPQFHECIKNVYKEYYPQGNGEVKGDFLCAQYKTDDKLIPTNISTEPNGPCYHYGYTIKNNVCYQIPQEFFDCTAGEDRKKRACNQYLEDVTAKVAEDKYGLPYEKICEAKVNVPVNISNVDNQQAPNVQPAAPARQLHKNIFSRITNFFRCIFLKLFGKSC